MAPQPIRIHSNLPHYWEDYDPSNPPPSRSPSPSSLPPAYVDAIREQAVSRNSTSSENSDTADNLIPTDQAALDGGAKASTSTADATASLRFHSVVTFRIENKGHPWIALPTPPRPDPIPVYAETAEGGLSENPVYTSIRDQQSKSSNCVLVRNDTNQPVTVTVYRFGAGKPPLLRFTHDSPTKITSQSDVHEFLSPAAGLTPPSTGSEESIEVHSEGYTTRAQVIHTSLGTFRWRYGSKSERREVQVDYSRGLLILERITPVTPLDSSSERGLDDEDEESSVKVAQLLRSDETQRRAGSGGRLSIDLRLWTDKKGEREKVEALIVSSCLVMLKKEIDRRRLQQAMLIVGAAG